MGELLAAVITVNLLGAYPGSFAREAVPRVAAPHGLVPSPQSALPTSMLCPLATKCMLCAAPFALAGASSG